MINCIENNSGRPVDALAVKKVNHSLTDTLKSRARLKKHCNKNYANGGDGNFAVLDMMIFFIQANISFEYDDFSYSGKNEF